jgi:type IV pilus assembly protein PilQ
MNKHAIKLLSGIGLALACAAEAGPAITNISAAAISSTEQVLEITFDGPAPNPTSFSMANPPRIAFDFPDTGVKLPSAVQNLGNQLVRSATTVEAGRRARLVLNLSQSAGYTTQVIGNKLRISLSSDQGARPAQAAAANPAKATQAAVAAPASQSDTALDFRRSGDTARVEITLPSAATPVDVRRDRANILVELPGTPLPASQLRKLDVTDFGTAVNRIVPSNSGRTGHILIEPQGDWDFSSYQTDRKLVVEVRKIEPEKAKTASPPIYKGNKLSLDFQNIDVRTVLQVLADFTGLNIVASDTVTGSITLRLKDVPWDQALDLILQAKGLDKRQVGNVVQIAPREELLDRDKKILEAQKSLETLEPLRSETFMLKYRSTDDFKAVLDTDSGTGTTAHRQTILSDRGSVLFDPKTNTIIVNDTPTVLDKVRSLVDQLDKAQRQVLIEARIVEATDNWARDLGVKLGYSKLGNQNSIANNFNNATNNTALRQTNGNAVFTYNQQVAAYQQQLAVYQQQLSQFNGTGTPPALPTAPTPPTLSLPTLAPSVNLPASLAGASTIAVVSNVWGGLLGLELSAMQAENKGKIISSPRILTSDRTEATIQQGTQIPYQSATSSGATAISFINAVLSLKVKPQVTPDGHVIMDVSVNKDSPSPTLTVNGTPAIDTTQVQTLTMVENGGTLVIGGIYVEDNLDTTNKVPLLGDIPILGNLFKENLRHKNRKELIVFLTPRIIDNINGANITQ